MNIHSKLGIAILVSLFSGPLALAQDEVVMEPETVLTPEVEFAAKDAGQVRDLMQENAWMQTFRQSNLYRGLMMQTGPVLNAIGENFKGAWQGKLLDYAFQEVMRGRQAVVRVFQRRSLVSPFVVTVRDLGKSEREIVTATAKMISGGSPHVLTLNSDLTPKQEDDGEEAQTLYTAEIWPVRINNQRFAIVLDDGCFSLGRDPVATASAAHICRNEGRSISADAEVSVQLQAAYPAVYTFAQNFLGIAPQWQAQFKWNDSLKRYEPTSATMKLQKDHLFGVGDFERALSILPATVELAAVMAAPVPYVLDPAAVSAFLGQSRASLRNEPRRTVVVANLGPPVGEDSVDRMVILVDWPKDVDAGVIQNASYLFGEASGRAYVRGVCQKWLAISPSSQALGELEKVCQRSVPALADAPLAKQVFTGADRSMAFYFNLGGLLAQTLDYGLISDGKKGTKVTAEARDLLSQLPVLAAYGKAEGSELKMKGVMQ